MRPTTRLRLLEYLRKQQTASAGEVSHALGMTGADIRHHLAVLKANELVEVIGQRREGRGRPVNLYSLSRRVLGDGLDVLSSALLSEWLGRGSERQRVAALRSMARRLAQAETGGKNASLTSRLGSAIEHLNQLHYQARWEAAASGPRLILGHCPYAAILERHPELCQMDVFLLEAEIGSGVQQTAKMRSSAKGLPFCEFLVAWKTA